MLRHIARAVILTLALGFGAQAQTPSTAAAQAAVTEASRAMGVESLGSIRFYGSGATYNLGQNNNAEGPWPRVNVSDFSRWIDFAQPASRATGTTLAPPNAGGPAVQGALNQVAMPANLAWGQHLEIWTTPWGFLKGAARNGAALTNQTIDGVHYQVLTWSPPQKAPSGASYRVVGYIGPDKLVRRVQTWVENPVMGDIEVNTTFANYRQMFGVRFPTTIQRTSGGWPTFDLQVLGIEVNPADIAQRVAPPPPPAQQQGQQQAQAPASASPLAEQLAPGVWRVRGAYNALVIEFRDYVLLYEPGPNNEARANAIIAEARRLVPGKPIRYGVLSHHHFDHTGGLSAVVGEGITIVADESAKPFLERVLSNPRTLAPDAISRSGKKPVVEAITGGKRVFSDADHSFEAIVFKDLSHADDLVLGWLPKERIAITADLFTPLAPGAQAPNPPLERTMVLLNTIERLGLNPERIYSVHPYNPDRPTNMQELRAAAGR